MSKELAGRLEQLVEYGRVIERYEDPRICPLSEENFIIYDHARKRIAEIKRDLCASSAITPTPAKPVAWLIEWDDRVRGKGHMVSEEKPPHYDCNRVTPLVRAAPQSLSPEETPESGIYVASRVARAPEWRSLREQGHPIISTWIDEDGEGDTDDFGELWQRIQGEIAECAAVIFWGANEDAPWKGAFIEVGIALALGKPVYAVVPGPLEGRTMRPLGSWLAHPNVIRCATVDEAMRSYMDNERIQEKK